VDGKDEGNVVVARKRNREMARAKIKPSRPCAWYPCWD